MSQKSIQEKSRETAIVEDILRGMKMGDVVTYSDLSRGIGSDILRNRSPLYSAIRICGREGMVFGAVRCVGIKRLDDREIVDASEGDLRRTRRIAARSSRKLRSVNFESLDPARRIAHNVKLATMAVIVAIGKEKSQKKIGASLEETRSQGALPLEETLRLFCEEED